MFEATLYTADLDRPRLQRLTLAAAIAITTTTAAIASMWTLDRMHIDRIVGPAQQFELAQFSLLPPPPVTPPPPPPDVIDGGDDDPDDRDERKAPDPISTKDTETLDVDNAPSEIPPPRTITGAGTGIPDLLGNGGGCPGGVCNGLNTGKHGGPPCLGPHCGMTGTPPIKDAAPTEVEFSALRCLACADPDRAALRKTSASMQGREGKVVARFCVDVRGRVEASSIEIDRSYGDAAVDRIVRAAIKGWRFSPMKVGNQPRRACSSASFNIRFD
jgi:TonB family protein